MYLLVFPIWIRINMFLGLRDPHSDPLVRGTDPKIRIRIRTQMTGVRNTNRKYTWKHSVESVRIILI